MNINFLLTICYLSFVSKQTCAQTGAIFTSWIKSTGTGYNSILANIYKIQYSADYVYVYCNSIPSYSNGPWNNNPNDASSQDFTFKFPRNPVQKSGTKKK